MSHDSGASPPVKRLLPSQLQSARFNDRTNKGPATEAGAAAKPPLGRGAAKRPGEAPNTGSSAPLQVASSPPTQHAGQNRPPRAPKPSKVKDMLKNFETGSKGATTAVAPTTSATTSSTSSPPLGREELPPRVPVPPSTSPTFGPKKNKEFPNAGMSRDHLSNTSGPAPPVQQTSPKVPYRPPKSSGMSSPKIWRKEVTKQPPPSPVLKPSEVSKRTPPSPVLPKPSEPSPRAEPPAEPEVKSPLSSGSSDTLGRETRGKSFVYQYVISPQSVAVEYNIPVQCVYDTRLLPLCWCAIG